MAVKLGYLLPTRAGATTPADDREAACYERSAPYGRPRDMAERMKAGTPKNK